MFKHTHQLKLVNPQPREDILGGLLLAACVCWTVTAFNFLPSNRGAADTEVINRGAEPTVLVDAQRIERFASGKADQGQRFIA